MGISNIRWTCPSCGRKDLLESKIACSDCQAKRPKDVSFYYVEEVAGEEELPPLDKKEKKGEFGCGVFFWGIGLACLLMAIIAFFPHIEKAASSVFSTVGSWFSEDLNAEITGLKWERVATLMELTEVTESGYSLPQGATLISTEKVRQYGETKRIDRGVRKVTRTITVTGSDGNPEEKTVEYEDKVIDEMPVYRDEYTYRIKRWKAIKELKSAGRDKNLWWLDDFRLSDEKNYRIGTRKEFKYVTLRLPDGSSAEAEAGTDLWNTAKTGDKIKVIKHGITGKYSVAPPE